MLPITEMIVIMNFSRYCNFPCERNLDHWAVVHFMLSAGLHFVSGLLWFTFLPCLWLHTSGAHLLCEPALASYLSALHEAHKYLTCLLRKLNLFLKATSVGKDRFKIFLLNIKIICPRPQFGIY